MAAPMDYGDDEYPVPAGEVVEDIEVEIKDPELGVAQGLICPSNTALRDIKKKYGEAMNRYIQPGSSLSHDGQMVDEDKTLAQHNAQPDEPFELVFATAPFEIIVKEKEGDAKSGTRLRVHDTWRVHKVKEAYSREASHVEGLIEGDRLVYNGVELADGKELFRYALRADCVLTVQREDVHAIVTRYSCGDCGSEVRLKKDDVVRCRECGCRIVFKIRPIRPIQWQAR